MKHITGNHHNQAKKDADVRRPRLQLRRCQYLAQLGTSCRCALAQDLSICGAGRVLLGKGAGSGHWKGMKLKCPLLSLILDWTTI
jgi:hypothetical protein